MAQIYRRFLRVSAFLIFPLLVGLSAVAKPLVLLLLKEQWLFAATLLQIICFSMMWYPIHAINLNLLQVKGRSDLFLKLEIIKKNNRGDNSLHNYAAGIDSYVYRNYYFFFD